MGASRESGITLALLIATLCAHSNLAYRPSSGREMRDERCTMYINTWGRPSLGAALKSCVM